jgi:hypothetical protein
MALVGARWLVTSLRLAKPKPAFLIAAADRNNPPPEFFVTADVFCRPAADRILTSAADGQILRGG